MDYPCLGLIATTLTVGLFVLVGEANGQPLIPNDESQIILNYCYQHADIPNPVQDLLDKGLVSANFTGETCGSIKQAYDEEQTRIREEIENRTAENLDRKWRYEQCLTNKTKTSEECSSILQGPFQECMADRSKTYEDCRRYDG